ncbi:MAG: hypothetical protein K6A41_00345 [Bacteroidales bacterium]|nr:hypothetical protein [Bacteroidales bacterium]
MKKVFLALLCAGLFFACGNKKTAEEPAIDSTACQEEVVVDEPVADEPVAEVTEAPAQETKTTTTSGKKQTVKQNAQQAAENVANAAIDKGEQAATEAVTTTPTQSKRRR